MRYKSMNEWHGVNECSRKHVPVYFEQVPQIENQQMLPPPAKAALSFVILLFILWEWRLSSVTIHIVFFNKTPRKRQLMNRGMTASCIIIMQRSPRSFLRRGGEEGTKDRPHDSGEIRNARRATQKRGLIALQQEVGNVSPVVL